MTTPQDERLGLPSASSAERWMNCPGSFLAEKEFPEDSTEPAERGTRIHEELHEGDGQLKESEQAVADRLAKTRDQIFNEWFDQSGPGDGGVCDLMAGEKRFWIEYNDQPIVSAKLDFSSVVGERALIIDFKTGWVAVESASENWQIRVQAAAIQFAHLQASEVLAVVLSPQGAKTSQYEFSSFELQELCARVIQGALKAMDPKARRYPGTWCQWCKARATCPEAAAWSLIPIPKVGPGDVVQRVAQMPLEALVVLQKHANAINSILEAVSKRLKSFPLSDLAQHGLTLKTPSGKRVVANVEGAYLILGREGLIKSKEEFFALVSAPIGAIEELAIERWVEKHGGTQKDAKKALSEILEPVIRYEPQSPRLVPLPKQGKQIG